MKVGIYIPGLASELSNCSMDSYIKNFMKALDKNDPDKNNQYNLKFEKVTFDGFEETTFNVGAIYRQQKDLSNTSEVLYKMYELDYENEFTANFKNSNVFKQSLLLFWGLFKMTPVFIRSFFYGPGLNRKQRYQSFYFFIIMILVALFTVMLFPSLITLVADNISSFKAYLKNIVPASFISYMHTIKSFSKTLIAVTGVIAVFFPLVQKIIAITAMEYLCVHYYLKYGEGKQTLTGKLSLLVEKIAEQENYESFEIHAYSFGSIIAIDTLFPKNSQNVDLRIKKEITHLTTVGCPFDFLRVYYKHYFENRNQNQTQIKEWVNVKSALDVLSSNFRNDSLEMNSDPLLSPGGISIKNIDFEIIDVNHINWLDYVFLLSFKTHRMYWETNSNSSSFFTNYLNK